MFVFHTGEAWKIVLPSPTIDVGGSVYNTMRNHGHEIQLQSTEMTSSARC